MLPVWDKYLILDTLSYGNLGGNMVAGKEKGRLIARYPLHKYTTKIGPRLIKQNLMLVAIDVGILIFLTALFLTGKVRLTFFALLFGVIMIFALFPLLIIHRYRRRFPQLEIRENGIKLPYYYGLIYRRGFIPYSEIKAVYVSPKLIKKHGLMEKWGQCAADGVESPELKEFLESEMENVISGVSSGSMDMGTYIVLKDGLVLMTLSPEKLGQGALEIISKYVPVK